MTKTSLQFPKFGYLYDGIVKIPQTPSAFLKQRFPKQKPKVIIQRQYKYVRNQRRI